MKSGKRKTKIAGEIEKQDRKSLKAKHEEEQEDGKKKKSPRRLEGQVHPVGDLNSQYVESQLDVEKVENG
jgi:hypothetical protein